MEITVKGLVAIDHAVVPLESVTLLVGHNEAGKTTIIEAAGSALTQEPLMRGIKYKNDLAAVVRDTYETGDVMVGDQDGTVTVSYPDGEVKTYEDPPRASEVAVGRLHITQADAKTRARVLLKALEANPTGANVRAELSARSISSEMIESVLDGLKRNGFDAAHKAWKDHSTKLKGRWEAVAEQKYGSNKAKGFEPPGWHPSLEGRSLEGLQQDLDVARQDVENLVARQGISSERQGELQRQIDAIPELTERRDELFGQINDTGAEIVELEEERAQVPSDQVTGIPCPMGCENVKFRIMPRRDGHELRVAEQPPSDAELKERRVKIAELDGKLSNLKGKVNQWQSQKADIEAELRRCEAAQKTLDEAGSGDFDPEDLSAARGRKKKASANYNAKKTKTEADRVAKEIEDCEKIIAVLAPEGLRKKLMTAQLERFNGEALKPLSDAFGIAPVMLDTELDVYCGDRPYLLLSKGAQFAVDAVLQLAIAQKDGSHAVLIDGADVLVGKRRTGLVKAALVSEMPTMIGMAVKSAEQVPDLSAKGLGHTYWVEDGSAFDVATN